MWQSEPVPDDEALRQGDYLKDMVVPTLTLPFRVSHPMGGAIKQDDRIVLPQRTCDLLVVSQCCSIAHNSFVAVARVRPYSQFSAVQEAGMLAEEPIGLEDAHYNMDAFRLAPHPELPQLIPEMSGARYYCADLGSIFSLSGNRETLNQFRVARMTAAGRRLLRIKLSLFWGRPEEEDVLALNDLGLPPGLTTEATGMGNDMR